ncbi:patatin-like phospholipase family protein [Ferrigenium kumadai]|uniref:patatin-like phospholipase family protein n=1 Tax=Ferrigenium kumadai TaxID=1682490 RepID=UPI001FE42584|nr:patatin-like phospholipase family protein [Ferrigenium kumadai]
MFPEFFHHPVKIARQTLFLVLLPFLLAACASTPPIQYKNVVQPQSVFIEPIQSDRPIVALALGSGGERGFAHVGVIKALEANGISIDIVVGTSAGSVVGALYAGGYKGDALEQLALKLDQAQLDDFELSKRGYIRGELLQDFVNKALKNRSIEQLDKPFVAIATQLGSGNAVAFNRGNTGMAVRASSSIPGVFLPVVIGGEEYVDGDLKKPVPVSVAREMGADIVIAVDISQQPKDNPAPEDIIDTLTQSIRIMRQSILARELEAAQIVIRPAIGQTPEIDTASKRRLIKNGEDAAVDALPLIRDWLQKIANEKTLERAERQRLPKTR